MQTDAPPMPSVFSPTPAVIHEAIIKTMRLQKDKLEQRYGLTTRKNLPPLPHRMQYTMESKCRYFSVRLIIVCLYD